MPHSHDRLSPVVDLETTLRVPRSKRAEFLQTVVPATESSPEPLGREHGRAGFYQSLSDPSLILWIERWPSRAALGERVRTPAFRTLMGAARALGRVLDIRLVDDSLSGVREARPFQDDELEGLIANE